MEQKVKVKVYYQHLEAQENQLFRKDYRKPVEQLATVGHETICVSDVHVAAEEQAKAGQEQHL